MRVHINDWAASDDGSTNDVASSLEADFDVLHQVILYTIDYGCRAVYVMDACMEMIDPFIVFDDHPMHFWETTVEEKRISSKKTIGVFGDYNCHWCSLLLS